MLIIHEGNLIFEDVGLVENYAVWIFIYVPTFWRFLPLSSRSNKSKHLFPVASTLKIAVASFLVVTLQPLLVRCGL